jgi:hypothetical protein
MPSIYGDRKKKSRSLLKQNDCDQTKKIEAGKFETEESER